MPDQPSDLGAPPTVEEPWPPPALSTEEAVTDEPEPHRLRGRRRLIVLAVCAAVTVLAAVVITVRLRQSDAPAVEPGVDTWAPYWALDESLPELDARAEQFRELSPFWFAAEGVDSIVVDENADGAQTDAFMETARRSGSRVVPSIVDAMPSGAMAAMLADPAQRARHVDALARFAEEGSYAGLDIDYEKFAFSDDRSTWDTTRPAWVAFVTALAERLHTDGRTLTVSIPPIYDAGRTSDSGFWVYAYDEIAPVVDRIRVMAYDYSTDAPGPIAPLAWVQEAIDSAVEATGEPSKLVLGVPLYGYNWLVSTVGSCPPGEAPDRTGVTARSAGDLAAERGAEPVYDETTAEWAFTYRLDLTDGTTSCTQTRQVHYVDSRGATARMALADAAGLAGSSFWALGYEDDALWSTLSETGQATTVTTTG